MKLEIAIGKKTFFILAIISLAVLGSATITFNDSNPVRFMTNIDMAGNNIQNLGSPANPDAAATKNYVDSNDNVNDPDSDPNNEGADNKCSGNRILTGEGNCISANTGSASFQKASLSLTVQGEIKTQQMWSGSGNLIVDYVFATMPDNSGASNERTECRVILDYSDGSNDKLGINTWNGDGGTVHAHLGEDFRPPNGEYVTSVRLTAQDEGNAAARTCQGNIQGFVIG